MNIQVNQFNDDPDYYNDKSERSLEAFKASIITFFIIVIVLALTIATLNYCYKQENKYLNPDITTGSDTVFNITETDSAYIRPDHELYKNLLPK